MHIGILAAPKSWYLADLQRAGSARHRVTRLDYQCLCALVESAGETLATAKQNLGDLDCVVVRTMPAGSLEQVVFRMDLLGRAEAAGCLVVNPPKAVETAVDKYLTTSRLAAAGLPVPRTHVSQTLDDALQAFAALGGDVVVKPLFGSEGRGLVRINEERHAEHVLQTLVREYGVVYMQEFVPHAGYDVRVLLIGERAWAIRRSNGNDWRTNVARGGKPLPMDLDNERGEKLAALARHAQSAVGAPLSGVDLLIARDGRELVLEVNAIPGWKALSSALRVDVAAAVIAYVEEHV